MALFDNNVRTHPGVPPLGAFSASGGTPLVIDTVSDHGYYVRPDGTMHPLGVRLGAGAFADSTTQTQSVINTAKAVTFNTTLASQGVALGSPTSRIIPSYPGLYLFYFSLELQSGSASAKNIWVWPRRTGVDIPNSNTKATLTGTGTTMEFGLPYPLLMAAGDYLEIMWAVDDLGLVIQSIAAPAFGPAVPSALLTAVQIT